jgi:hypothetical protein
MGNAVKKISENEGAVEMSVLKSDPVTVPGVNNQKEGSSVYSPDPDPVLDSGSVSGSVQAKVPELSLLERIQKVEYLSILVEKRSQLQASLREISQFKLSSDSMSNRVSIRNAATQREFNTSNSEVISEIIDVIIRKVEGKLSEVEAMITF